MSDELRCSVLTEALGADPIGTAGTYDAFVVVPVPLPWPAEILDHHDLAGAREMVDQAAADGRSVRVLGSVPEAGEASVLRHWEAGGPGYVGTESPLELATLAAAIAGEQQGTSITTTDVLLCTHGTRDRCCGSFGTRLHQEVAGRWPGVRFVRISHTGGHRYAPTAIVMPMGRSWAYLDEDVLARVVHRAGDVADVAAHDRGSPRLPAACQVVDRSLLVEHGWEWLDVERQGEAEQRGDGTAVATVSYETSSGPARRTDEVVVGREIPAFTCGTGPDGSKAYPELRISLV